MEGNEIVIRFRFVPHDSKNLTQHFAMIPVGNINTGRYSVSVECDPFDREFSDKGFTPIPDSKIEEIVCAPFEFTVTDP